MNLASSIAGARSLWNRSGKLGLNTADRLKYTLSWYLSRNALLTNLAPSHFTLRLPGGVKACIRPNGRDFLVLSEIFGEGSYKSGGEHPKRVLDLGANIGMATLFFASQFSDAEIACVEPFPGNQSILRENIRINQIRAVVFDGAVGTDSGEADLHIGSSPDMLSLTSADPAGGPTLRVRQFSVPDLLDELRWDQIDLLKIDIEGYEKTLFHSNNAWLSRVRRILGEAHGCVGYGIDQVRNDLGPFGFEVMEKSFDPDDNVTIFAATRSGGSLV